MPAKRNNYGHPLAYDPNFNGPLQKRHCTDSICLGIFIVFITGWVAVGWFAIDNGNPSSLLHPTDSFGRKCGQDISVKNKPFLFLFDITKCITPAIVYTGCQTPQICVSQCPNETVFAFADTMEEEQIILEKLLCKRGADKTKSLSHLVSNMDCPSFQVKSIPIARYCIPALPVTGMGDLIKDEDNKMPPDDGKLTFKDLMLSSKYLAKFLTAKQAIDSVVEDITKSWKLLLVCLGIAMGVSFIYLCLMYCVGKILIWMSLLGSFVLLVLGFYFALKEYTKVSDKKEDDIIRVDETFTKAIDSSMSKKHIWIAVMVLIGMLFFILLLVFIFLRRKIFLALAMIDEASRSVVDNPLTLVFPILPWILELIVVAYGVAVAVFLASGNPIYLAFGINSTECSCEPFKEGQRCNPTDFEEVCKTTEGCNPQCRFVKHKESTIWLQAYNIMGMTWCTIFTLHFGQLTLAGTFATWYWTWKKKKDLLGLSVIYSFWRTLRYHLGTVSLGSFLVAVTTLLSKILSAVEQRTHKRSNRIVRILLCWCKCCMWMFNTFLCYITSRVYIGVAIHGKSFMRSAVHEFQLFMRNFLQVTVLNNVVAFLFFFGKILMVGTMTIVSYILIHKKVFLDTKYQDDLKFPFSFVAVVAVCTYFIASMFISVFVVATNTIFHCFLEDRERNDGSIRKPYYMSKRTMEILQKK